MVLGSIPASVGTVDLEGWQMKQCWIYCNTEKNEKSPKKIFIKKIYLQVDSRRVGRWPSTRRSPAARSWGAWQPSPAGSLSTSRCAANQLHSIFPPSGPRLGTYRQYYGTGTVATAVTFCRRGTGLGTVINYASGTGSRIVIKFNHKNYQRHNIIVYVVSFI
jgi:hypothetical protein